MVKEIIIDKKMFYQCGDCKLIYKDDKWAEKCEKWCLVHHTCNLAITNHKLSMEN